jgi:histidine triad (HIT) family protein
VTPLGVVEPSEEQPCSFCDYLSGRRPYTIIARTSGFALMVTREQRGIGHLLVVPIVHRPTILDLTDGEARDLMSGLQLAARSIDIAYGRPGISIWQNNGVAADQTIAHVHFHVAGTLPGGGTERGEVSEVSLEQTEAIGETLRRAEGSPLT